MNETQMKAKVTCRNIGIATTHKLVLQKVSIAWVSSIFDLTAFKIVAILSSKNENI
jgi:hypothetical protein